MLKDALEYLVSLQPYREKIGRIEYADRPCLRWSHRARSRLGSSGCRDSSITC